MTSHILGLQISIKTNLPTVDKAVAVIADVTFTETHSWLQQLISTAPKGKLYEGYVHPNGFRIRHINIYRKISPTHLDGNFILTDHGVNINIHCQILQPSFMVWMLYFFGIIASLVVLNVIATGRLWYPPIGFVLTLPIISIVMSYFYALAELILAKIIMNWLFKEKTIPTLPAAATIAKPPQHLALTSTLPIDPPIATWKTIPIMPNAIAGQETITNYQYITKASSDEVKDYYLKTLLAYGWQYKQDKPATLNKNISVLPNEKNGHIIYLGNTFDFIYIYSENELTHVDILLATVQFQKPKAMERG